MKSKLKVVWFGYVVLFLSGAVAIAQTITGSIRGTVTDSTGAVVAGASVTVRNTGTGVTGNTVTNKSGLYDFEFLVIGDYVVTTTASGFQTASVGPFHVQIDQIVTADAKLTVGAASSTINVTADQSLLLDTENSTLSTSISAHTLESMPLNGQNVLIASLFVPGSTNPNSASMSGAMGTERDAAQGYSSASEDQPSFNGNRQQSNSFILDGIDINETIGNSLGYSPSPYSIEEVHVITGNADAEFGNVNGGEVVMVTKGGTNQFHGSAFIYHQASGLAANTYSNKNNPNPASRLARTNFTQNQFGGAAGGPIFKNKLFFFGNYIGTRHNIPPSQKAFSTPTLAERGLAPTATCPAGNADLSGVLSIDGYQMYDTTNGTAAQTPYVSNCIPIVNPAAKFLFSAASESVLPLPNSTPSSGTYTGGNYIGTQTQTANNDQGDIRVDYTISKKDTLMAKYSYGDAWDLTTPQVPVLFPYGSDYPFTSAAIAWTHIFSPAIVNNFRAGYTRILLNQGNFTDPSGVFGNHGDATLGIPLANQSIAGFTFMSLGSSKDLSNFGTQILGTYNEDNNFDYNDSLTWEHGKHIIKFGGDFLRYQQNYFAPGNLSGVLGQFSYTGAFTTGGSYGFGDFILDKAKQAQIAGVTGPFGMRQWRDAAFIQDDWKILPNLTLNLGVRYSYEQPNYEVNNKMVNVNLPVATFAPIGTPIQSMLSYAGQYNPTTGKVNSRALYNPYYLDIMPRFGFALKVTPRMVVRGGYGTTDELESTGYGLRMTQNPPYQPNFSQNAQVPSLTSGGTWFQAENGFTALGNTNVSGGQYDAWDPNMRPAIIQQFSLNVQYQIDNYTSVQAGYVGQLGQHLAVPLGLEQYTQDEPSDCDTTCKQKIEPYYALVGDGGIIIETTSRGLSNYHGLQITLQHHQSKGLEFLVNYTLSKSMTNNPGYFNVDGAGYAEDDSFWQDVHNPQGDYGPSNFDARHIVSGSAVYSLPFGHGKQFGANWNRVADEVVGGWQLSGNLQINSGYPLSATANPNCANNCPGNLDYVSHANQYGKLKIVHRGKNAGIFDWFGTDPSATPCQGASDGVCAYGNPTSDFGNAHVGTERGPGFQNYDLSLFKGFRTFREQTVKARIDAFNAFNISSYGEPNMNTNSGSTFGAIGSTRSAARQLQLSLVYQF